MSAAPRLSRSTWPPAGPARPVRLVHLGLGAFHRAHQAWYTDRAGGGWGTAAFTGRSPAAAVPLREQDGLYALIVRGPDGDAAEVVTSTSAALDGADTAAWCAHLADPAVAVVTLTTTEAGYRRAARGGLDLDDGRVRADVAALRADPAAVVTTAPVRLAQGLAARWRADGGPLAVASCDNLAGNGAITRRVVLDACEAVGSGLAAWVQEAVSFPSSVVDRITPATTEEDRLTAAALTGRRDEAPVVTEPFTEWVISGSFPAGRPAWEDAGAAVVDDVTPFEQRKLWLLNGGHSLLAYAGLVRGLETIAEAVADATCRAWLEELWDDAAPHVPLPRADVARYRADLLRRFADPRIRHRLAQIASDGSQKLPLRVLPVVRLARGRGDLPLGEVRALAAWVVHVRGGGGPVTDARAERVAELVEGPLERAVQRVLAELAPDLADDAGLRAAVVEEAGALLGAGPR